jgi:hypothetical protein
METYVPLSQRYSQLSDNKKALFLIRLAKLYSAKKEPINPIESLAFILRRCLPKLDHKESVSIAEDLIQQFSGLPKDKGEKDGDGFPQFQGLETMNNRERKHGPDPRLGPYQPGKAEWWKLWHLSV